MPRAKTEKIPEHKWGRLPKQKEFLECDSREVLYSGAFGAGKTRAVCMKAVRRALKRGAREGLCRKHLTDLKATTLRTLLETEGNLPPVLPEGSYQHNKADKTIKLNDGGEIYYFGLDDEGDSTNTKTGSLNLSGVGIDQCEEVSENSWKMLRGRSRLDVQELPNQIYGACNPRGPTHFIAVRFGLDGIHTPATGCTAIRTCLADNHLLRPEYVEDMNRYTGLFYKRYVLGEWAAAEGMVYPNFDPQIYVRHREGPFKQTIIGGDSGIVDPTCLLVVQEDEKGRIHVADEFYKSNQLPPDVLEEARRMRDIYHPTAFPIDPSALVLRETFTRAGLNAIAANNDRAGGVSIVGKYFVCDGQGVPMMTIDPRCVNLIRELLVYEMNPKTDLPRDGNDHACDALRYALMYLNSLVGEFEVRLLGENAPRSATRVGDSNQGWTNVFSQDDRNEQWATRQLMKNNRGF